MSFIFREALKAISLQQLIKLYMDKGGDSEDVIKEYS